jgi:hypothetical protein
MQRRHILFRLRGMRLGGRSVTQRIGWRHIRAELVLLSVTPRAGITIRGASEDFEMRRLVKSLLIGNALTTALGLATLLSNPKYPALPIVGWLLSPGILLGFAIGSGHVHDMSFWGLTFLLNVIIYSAVVYAGLWGWDAWHRGRKSEPLHRGGS